MFDFISSQQTDAEIATNWLARLAVNFVISFIIGMVIVFVLDLSFWFIVGFFFGNIILDVLMKKDSRKEWGLIFRIVSGKYDPNAEQVIPRKRTISDIFHKNITKKQKKPVKQLTDVEKMIKSSNKSILDD